MTIKQLKNYARDCVSNYARFDGNQYTIDVDHLSDFIQNEFASLIMSQDEAYAAESTGADNRDWQSKMLPALISYLSDSTDKDKAIRFQDVWLDSVTNYFKPKMQSLLNEAAQEYNEDVGYPIKDRNQYYGVAHLFGA